LTFGPGLYQGWIFTPHLFLDRICVLVCKITRHIAIAVCERVMVDISKEMCLLIHFLAKKKDHDPLTFGPEQYQDGIGCPHLYLDRICVPCL
jgi:hypothetical protein